MRAYWSGKKAAGWAERDWAGPACYGWDEHRFMGMVLRRGGRGAAKMAASFGLGGAACLALSGLLLAFH